MVLLAICTIPVLLVNQLHRVRYVLAHGWIATNPSICCVASLSHLVLFLFPFFCLGAVLGGPVKVDGYLSVDRGAILSQMTAPSLV